MIKKQLHTRLPASQNDSYLIERTKTRSVWLALLVPALAIVLAIWLPFGFELTGLIEEWDVLGLFNKHGLFFFARAASPLALHVLRPLTIFPHAIAYFLDPNSFYYWHVLLILALILKGSASSHLIWKATGSLKWAAVMGALVLVYPADTMQLSFRGLHINWALSLLLLASSIFVVAYEQKRAALSYGLGVVAAMLLFAAGCMYEAVLTLAPLPLLIPFVRDGFRTSLRQLRARWMLALVWMAGAGIYAIYAVPVASKVANYQSSVIAENTVTTLIGSLPKLFSVGALRGLLGGWFDATQMVLIEFSSYAYLVAATMAIGILILLIAGASRRLNPQGPSNTSSAGPTPVRLIVSGLLLLLLGYAPFLLSPAHLAISQRTFLCATPGAVMVWLGLLILVSRYTKFVAGLMALALVFFGLGAQLFQFHHYVQISKTQRTLLRGIVENFDGYSSDKTLVLLDGSNQLGQTWMFAPENLRNALTYLYGHPVSPIEVCHIPSMEWQHADGLARKGTCVEEEHDWVFRSAKAVSGPGYVPAIVDKDLRIAKKQLITIIINPDGSASPNAGLDGYRGKLFNGKSTVALRYRGALAKSVRPFSPIMFKDQKIQDQYRWDFGNWWSLEIPTRGNGWREVEWQVNKFHHQSSAWKTEEESALYFDFLPTENKYLLRGKFDILNDPIRQSIKIRLNNIDLSYRWVSDGEFETEIQPGIILAGANEIEFNSTVDPKYYGLSAKLDWFEIQRK